MGALIFFVLVVAAAVVPLSMLARRRMRRRARLREALARMQRDLEACAEAVARTYRAARAALEEDQQP